MLLKLKAETIKIVVANDYITRLRGLMWVFPIYYGMLFPKCNAIHTFFMKESIDVLALNEQNEVLYIYRNLPPYKILRVPYSSNKTSILELPKNASKSISLGDILFFKDEDVV